MAMGVEKGDRVAIMSYNCPQWLWADFATLNAGAIVVTIYPTVSVQEMTYIIKDSGTKSYLPGTKVKLIRFSPILMS